MPAPRVPPSAAERDVPTGLRAALLRAASEADAVPGAYVSTPCRFWPLAGADARGLVPDENGQWVVVTCRRTGDPGDQIHFRERCLTAAQRFTLALAIDGHTTRWVGDVDLDPEALAAAGIDPAANEPVGLVWVQPG